MASLIFSTILLAIQTAAGQGPPPPSQNRAPGTPIDDHLWILLLAGVIFGIYLIYKSNRPTSKAS